MPIDNTIQDTFSVLKEVLENEPLILPKNTLLKNKRKTSSKMLLNQKLIQAVKKQNLNQFSKSLEEGANWKARINGKPLIFHIIEKLSPEFLDYLIEKTHLDLKNPTQEMKGIFSWGFEEDENLTELINMSGKNPNPKMMERLLKDVPVSDHLWGWFSSWNTNTLEWFFKTQDLFPENFEKDKKKLEYKNYFYYFLDSLFSRDPQNFNVKGILNRIKKEYPLQYQLLQEGDVAQKIWSIGLGINIFNINKTDDNQALRTLKTLIEFDIFPSLVGHYFPSGLVWRCIDNQLYNPEIFLLQSDNLVKQAVDEMKKRPDFTLFQLDVDHPLFTFFTQKIPIEKISDRNGVNLLQFWINTKININKKELAFIIKHSDLIFQENKKNMSIANQNVFIGTDMNLKDIPKEIRHNQSPTYIDTQKLIYYIERKNLDQNIKKSSIKNKAKTLRI